MLKKHLANKPEGLIFANSHLYSKKETPKIIKKIISEIKNNNINFIYHLGDLFNEIYYYNANLKQHLDKTLTKSLNLNEIDKTLHDLLSVIHHTKKTIKTFNVKFKMIYGNHDKRFFESFKSLRKILKRDYPDNTHAEKLINLVDTIRSKLYSFYRSYALDNKANRNYRRNSYNLFVENGYILKECPYNKGHTILFAHELLSEGLVWNLFEEYNIYISILNNKKLPDSINYIKLINELKTNSYISNKFWATSKISKINTHNDLLLSKEFYPYRKIVFNILCNQHKSFSYISKELHIKYKNTVKIAEYMKTIDYKILYYIIEHAMKEISEYEGDIKNFKYNHKKDNGQTLEIGNMVHSSLINTVAHVNSDHIKIVFGHHHMVFESKKKITLDNKKLVLLSPGAGGTNRKRSSGYIIFYTNGDTKIIKFED